MSCWRVEEGQDKDDWCLADVCFVEGQDTGDWSLADVCFEEGQDTGDWCLADVCFGEGQGKGDWSLADVCFGEGQDKGDWCLARRVECSTESRSGPATLNLGGLQAVRICGAVNGPIACHGSIRRHEGKGNVSPVSSGRGDIHRGLTGTETDSVAFPQSLVPRNDTVNGVCCTDTRIVDKRQRMIHRFLADLRRIHRHASRGEREEEERQGKGKRRGVRWGGGGV